MRKTLPEAQRTQALLLYLELSLQLQSREIQQKGKFKLNTPLVPNQFPIWSPDSSCCISSKFGHEMAPLTLVTNLVTRWRLLHQFQIWLPDSACCISSKFGHQMAPLALVTNLVTRWRLLYQFQIWSLDGACCISCKFGHQMAPLALVTLALPYCLGLSY